MEDCAAIRSSVENSDSLVSPKQFFMFSFASHGADRNLQVCSCDFHDKLDTDRERNTQTNNCNVFDLWKTSLQVLLGQFSHRRISGHTQEFQDCPRSPVTPRALAMIPTRVGSYVLPTASFRNMPNICTWLCDPAFSD